MQIILAIAIIVVVAVQLVDVSVSGTTYTYQCLLGQDYMSSSLCTYTFVVCGVSLVVSAVISMIQCCTCNLCGLGKILDVLLGALGTIWWAVASGVIGSNAMDPLGGTAQVTASSSVNTARDAVPIMCWVETGIFGAMLLSSLFRGKLPPPDLTKALISKGLGYGILAGSTLVKVPQVLNVVRARSAAGLSPLAFELETLGLVIAVTYGFLMGLPISAFGETVALLFQNCGLLVLIYFYQRRSLARTITLLSVLAGSGFVALSGTLSQAAITTLYDCNNFILVASRVPQIWQNFIAGSTGQLSLVTYALNTAGAAARIFTSVQENAGAAMLRGAVISTLLNCALALQIVFYAPKEAKNSKKKAA
ncbi:hypothetical protein CHLNCDRAFT_135683 [Chlorella variabilis]|uniref:Mannose-P-dolichol utilization defect 1 protein homolog n=1 Tax=Chlorella variabilis TaxID=554065 RepID=E1ZIR9_CHLVA|nr:hypothetical protein CHLNCDRAFT_135683 [Chlorella variabilis]EFN54382.1 hypothetical protein CHLNCDRAFT_135683 [Chlorella variabilis]|eukprot:XP_005846484.1 hypothetical protein CHLNCDRAFT_135683 [Chlorella variabilis]